MPAESVATTALRSVREGVSGRHGDTKTSGGHGLVAGGATRFAGLVAFYDERADFIVDGERQARPRTKFSQ